MAARTPASTRGALFYPGHQCHERTLAHLLDEYGTIHFRDPMLLSFSPRSSPPAYQDRMGHFHPELVAEGRIVQDHAVRGPLEAEARSAVNRDLADPVWRTLFHEALKDDRRFQRGLFDLSHRFTVGGTTVPGPAALLRLLEDTRRDQAWSVELMQALSERPLDLEDGYAYEYGLALVKTSAVLVHTVRLCVQHDLDAVTDSETHFRLLERTRTRDGLSLRNRLLLAAGS